MLRVLLVDDSPERTAILRTALERADYLVAAVQASPITPAIRS
jgi:CheY-like chemotaxis protein